jgi:hypothetical protein
VDQDEMSVRVVDIDVTVHVSSQDLDFQRHMPWSIIRIVDIESIKDQHCLNFHDIGKILLKVALNTKKSNQSSVLTFFSIPWLGTGTQTWRGKQIHEIPILPI